MKLRWVVTLLALVGVGIAVGWGLGLWDEPGPETPAPAPWPGAIPPSTQAPQPGPKKPSALDTAAWMLAHSQHAPAGPEQGRSEDQTPCGEAGLPCSRGRVCLNDTCLVETCDPHSSPKEACAMAGGRTGRCCHGGCLDVASDPANCGGCGRVCDPGFDCRAGVCQAPSCSGKMAGAHCATPTGIGSCCRDRCVEKGSFVDDTRNCGGCGHACAPGLSCVQSLCIDSATGRLPDYNCNQPGHTCRSDEFCVVDACYPRECGGGSDGQLCPMGSSGQVGHCCSGTCRDLFSDTDNCRACGTRCGAGQTCSNGECH